jgi:hypothetical protein
MAVDMASAVAVDNAIAIIVCGNFVSVLAVGQLPVTLPQGTGPGVSICQRWLFQKGHGITATNA